MSSQLRRYQDYLAVSGTGVIVFSFWSLIKTLVYYIRPAAIMKMLESMDLTYSKKDIVRYMLFMLAYMVVITAVRIYVGRCAIIEGRAGKKGIIYVFLAFCLLAESIYTITGYIDIEEGIGTDIIISSFLEELVSFLINCDLLFSLWKVRSIERRQKQ